MHGSNWLASAVSIQKAAVQVPLAPGANSCSLVRPPAQPVNTCGGPAPSALPVESKRLHTNHTPSSCLRCDDAVQMPVIRPSPTCLGRPLAFALISQRCLQRSCKSTKAVPRADAGKAQQSVPCGIDLGTTNSVIAVSLVFLVDDHSLSYSVRSVSSAWRQTVALCVARSWRKAFPLQCLFLPAGTHCHQLWPLGMMTASSWEHLQNGRAAADFSLSLWPSSCSSNELS